LSLLVKPNGTKLWEFRYTIHGKAAKLAIKGGFPNISVAYARRQAEELNAKIRSGIDPRVERLSTRERSREAAQAQQTLDRLRKNTFQIVAEDWLRVKHANSAQSTVRAMKLRLEKHVFPKVGGKSISEVEHDDILGILHALEDLGIGDNKNRIKGYCHSIFEHAKARKLIKENPITGIQQLMIPVKRGHRAAVTRPEDLAPMLRKFEEYPDGIVKIALKMIPYVFTRSAELCESSWAEFDLVRGIWTIPAERTKLNREHLVPLSKQVLNLLQQARRFSEGSSYVFPSPTRRKSPITTNSVLGASQAICRVTDQE